MADFQFQDIAGYQQQLLAGTTTCTAAVEHYLQAISRQSHLNAMVGVFEAEARARAAELDAMLQAGQALLPLHGVVVTIKDVLCYEGHPVTAASKMLQGYQAVYSATAVQRLLKAGAIIIGSTNCDEFAMGSTNEHSAYGPVRNAADPERVPGGSSGGAAVAVQAGLCMASIGSDTGGSVRQPAGHCGVTGLKPGYGRISRWGLIAYASSFDCIGILANSVADVALIYNQLAGPDGKDSTADITAPPKVDLQALKKAPAYRLAYLAPTMDAEGLDPEIKAAIEQTLAQLQAKGHQVTGVPFPLLEYVVPTYYVLTTAEASSNLGRFDGIRYGHQAAGQPDDLTAFYCRNRSEGFGKEVQRRIMLGSFVLSAGYYDAYFTKAQQVRRLLVDATAQIFKNFDAIIMPVSPHVAPKLGEATADPIAMYMADIFTVFANLTGVPALAVPLYRHSCGLPFGLQVLTNRGEEVLLHQLGAYLEKHFARR